MLSRRIKLGLITVIMTAVPMQQAIAYGSQWRPTIAFPGSSEKKLAPVVSSSRYEFRPVAIAPIAPLSLIAAVAPIAPISPFSPFMPFSPIAPTTPISMAFSQPVQQSIYSMPVPVRPILPVAPVAPVPTFARQYAWRPAVSTELHRSQVSLPAKTAQPVGYRPRMPSVQTGYETQGNWRPVSYMAPQPMNYMAMPINPSMRSNQRYNHQPQAIMQQPMPMYAPLNTLWAGQGTRRQQGQRVHPMRGYNPYDMQSYQGQRYRRPTYGMQPWFGNQRQTMPSHRLHYRTFTPSAMMQRPYSRFGTARRMPYQPQNTGYAMSQREYAGMPIAATFSWLNEAPTGMASFN